MDYKISILDKEYELPQYSFDIAEKITLIKQTNSLKSKCEKIYSLAKLLIGRENVESVFGGFEKVDPNKLLIFFSKVEEAYIEPVNSDTVKKIENLIEKNNLAEIGELFNKLEPRT